MNKLIKIRTKKKSLKVAIRIKLVKIARLLKRKKI